jgi:hypothetical protein
MTAIVVAVRLLLAVALRSLLAAAAVVVPAAAGRCTLRLHIADTAAAADCIHIEDNLALVLGLRSPPVGIHRHIAGHHTAHSGYNHRIVGTAGTVGIVGVGKTVLLV